MRKLMACLVALVVTGAGAKASITVYTNAAAFAANTTSLSTITFEGIVPIGGFNFYPPTPGLTLSGVTFTQHPLTSGDAFFVIGQNFYYPGNAVFSAQNGSTGVTGTQINLPTNINAFGFDYGTFSNGPVTLTLSTGESVTIPSTFGLQFIGIISTSPFSNVQVYHPGVVVNLDNVQFGQAPVPEPISLVVFGGLIVGGAGIALRRRMTKTAV